MAFLLSLYTVALVEAHVSELNKLLAPLPEPSAVHKHQLSCVSPSPPQSQLTVSFSTPRHTASFCLTSVVAASPPLSKLLV